MTHKILNSLALSGVLLALPGVAMAQEAEEKTHELKLGVEKGAKLAYQAETKQVWDFTGGMPMKISIDDKSSGAYEVLEVAEDGKSKLKVTFGHLHGRYTQPGVEMKWDSNEEPTTPQAQAATVLSGKSLTVSMDSTATFTSVEGTSDAIGDFATELASNPQLADDKKRLTDKGQLQGFQTAQVPLPADPVAIGATWSATRSVDYGPFTFEFTDKYTLEKIDGEVATLKMNGEGKLTETRPFMPGMPPAEATVNSYVRKGTITISTKDGMPRELAITDDGDISLDMMGSPMELKITSSLVTKSVDPATVISEEKTDEGAGEAEKAPDPDAPAAK